MTPDGKKVFENYKVLMPMAAGWDRDNKMMFGADRKTGYMVDTSLQPGKTHKEIVEIPFPEGVKKMKVSVRLWYLPSNPAENLDQQKENKDKFLFFAEEKEVSLP